MFKRSIKSKYVVSKEMLKERKNRRLEEEKRNKKRPKKANNNKFYRDFIKEARTWDKYKDMKYCIFLKESRNDYYNYKKQNNPV